MMLRRYTLFFLVFLSALISLFSVYAQECVENDYWPPCDGPFEQPCGCGGTQTRARHCDGGCTEWTDCRIGDVVIPTTEEVCTDSIDDDCDGAVDCADPDCGAEAVCIDSDGDGYPLLTDCADANPAINPGAVEVCNNLDDNCNGFRDEGVSRTCGVSAIGICTLGAETCRRGEWLPCTAVLPGTEVCDTLDNDCDGQVDEGCSCVAGATQQCGTDAGACTFGSQTCVAGAWSACTGGILPVEEVCGNSVDDDCDGAVDEFCTAEPEAAPPSPPAVPETPEPVPGVPASPGPAAPQAPELTCTDRDGDGFGPGCEDGPDCDDSDFAVNPLASEVCDGVDDDCNGRVDDGLARPCGYSDVGACTFGTETCAAGSWTDCTAVLPASERCGNNRDDDCDGDVDEGCGPALPAEQSALMQFLDIELGDGNYDRDEYLRQYQLAKDYLDIEKIVVVADGKTRIHIDLTPVQDLKNVKIYEYIPKHIASSVDKITFSIEPEIIQADPLVMWHFEEMTGKEDLRYVIDGEFEEAESDTRTLATAEAAAPKSRSWYFNLLPLIFIPILGLVFVVLIQILHRRHTE